MYLLAIDTTQRFGGVALAHDAEIVEAVAMEAPKGFAGVIYQEIQALLERHGVTLQDIDYYAGATGPGSFTGIRVGLSVVKALAEAHKKKVVPVSNLMAMAFAGKGRYRAPVMDARRDEVYAAVYDDQLRAVVDEVAAPWKKFLQLAGNREVHFIATDAALFGTGGAAPLDRTGNEKWSTAILQKPLVEAIARLAARQTAAGAAVVPEAVDANYIRRPDAELKWKAPAL